MKHPSHLLLALLPLFPACSGRTVDPIDAAPPAPAAWQAEAREPAPVPPDDAWWQSFGDPSLDELVAVALADNRNLAAAGARLDAALAQARIAGAPRAPQVSASLDGARRRQNFIGLPIPGGSVLSSTSTNLGISLNVAWEADLWGRLRAGESAGEARAAASTADLLAARLSLAGQTAKAWFAVLAAESQLELARATAASRRRSAEQVRGRFERGLRNAFDLRLALSNEAAANASLAQRERLADVARRQLQLLLGRYPSRELAMLGPDRGGLPTLPPRPPAGLPAELVERRPDLLAAGLRLEAAGFEVDAARAALYPSLRLTGSGGSVSSELEDLLDSDFSVWSLAAGLLQPVFQGGRLRAGVDLAEARRREAIELYAQQVLVAFAEVEQALAAASHLDTVYDSLAIAAEQATAAEELAEERYLAGLNDYLNVLEAQRQAFLARSQQLEVEFLRLANRVDLHLALGGADRPATQQASVTP